MTNKRTVRGNQKSQGKKHVPASLKQKLVTAHTKALTEACKQIAQTPISTFVTCLVMAMTLLITSILLVGVNFSRKGAAYLHASQQVTVYLKPGSLESQIKHWITQLEQEGDVKDLVYIPPSQALQELTQDPEYNLVLRNLSENPLPPVIQLKLTFSDSNLIKEWAHRMRAMPWVDSVSLDLEWITRLTAIITLINRASFILTLILGLGVLFIISHTIQAATTRNRREIEILQLMGATLPYIRRPFLYLGVLMGFFSGVLTLLLLSLIVFLLRSPLFLLFASYNITSPPPFFNVIPSFTILIMSTCLGWLGSCIAFYRYAKIL